MEHLGMSEKQQVIADARCAKRYGSGFEIDEVIVCKLRGAGDGGHQPNSPVSIENRRDTSRAPANIIAPARIARELH